MKSKILYAGAVLVMAFAAAGGATSHKSKIEIVYQPTGNGDYRLFLFGSDRTLVCEEKPIRVVEQGDSLNPLVIECKH